MLSGSEWSTWYRWHPDVRDLDGRVPMGVHCLQTLREKPSETIRGRYVITLRGWRVEDEAMWYRLYTAWRRHDSLASLIPKDRTERHKSTAVPEPALWAACHHLSG